MSPRDFDWFMSEFYQLTGINLREYKRPQMERRLTALRDRRGYTSYDDYMHAVSSNPGLLAELLDRMTINVSEFYRNKSRWDALVERVLPIIPLHKDVKIWSAACSTGEEPYTLLMTLSTKLPLERLSILATDIDERALTRAKEGYYAKDLIKPIAPDMVQKYFQLTSDGNYNVSKELRERITFKKHNLLRDSYPTEQDLIVCRNVLIYFTDEAKLQVYQKFARSLKSGGVLFVGSTEQIFHPETLALKQIEPFFYQKTS